jgi:hypothetical protein
LLKEEPLQQVRSTEGESSVWSCCAMCVSNMLG